MKKLILGCLLVAVCATAAFAEDSAGTPYNTVRMGVDLAYQGLAMDQVNQQLNTGITVTPIKSGISGMLDLEVLLAPFLMLGARAGYLSAQTGSSTHNYILYNQTTAINTSLIPLEAGVSANFIIPDSPVSVMAGVFGGYGFASASIKNEITTLGQTASVTQPYTGGGFIGELVAAVNIKLISTLSLNLNGGYSLAKISTLTQAQDVSYNGVPFVSFPIGAKGDVLKDADNQNLAFDFSGYRLGAGLSLGF